ncbi:MAG TPA: hypothetical protein VES65_08085 [Solirubrobacteraceae bacterium]|nr:hypothetical protein [Solirubrobacteraceae bacterium]
MRDQDTKIRSDEDRRLERAIVLQTLRDDHDTGWPRPELEAELGRPDPIAIGDALTRLNYEGVVELSGETVCASRAALRLSELELIAV